MEEVEPSAQLISGRLMVSRALNLPKVKLAEVIMTLAANSASNLPFDECLNEDDLSRLTSLNPHDLPPDKLGR